MSKVWNWIFSLPEFKIITVGLDNAGKTTIVYRLVLGDVVATIPTVGSNVEELVYKNLKFLVWDLGGQTVFRNTWSTYYTNTHAVIFVVDSTDRERISCAKDEFLKMLESDVKKTNNFQSIYYYLCLIITSILLLLTKSFFIVIKRLFDPCVC